MPSHSWLKGQEIAEEERQMQLQNESIDRILNQEARAVEIAREIYGSDDVEVYPGAFLAELPVPRIEIVDGGYWVEARVWVDADLVEERMSNAERSEP